MSDQIESMDTLRLSDAELAMMQLPIRAQRSLEQSGLQGIGLRRRLYRELADEQFQIHKLHLYAEKNDSRDRLTINVDGEEIAPPATEPETAVLHEELSERDNKIAELEEGIRRQAEAIERLTSKLAASAIAVNAEGSQR